MREADCRRVVVLLFGRALSGGDFELGSGIHSIANLLNRLVCDLPRF